MTSCAEIAQQSVEQATAKAKTECVCSTKVGRSLGGANPKGDYSVWSDAPGYKAGSMMDSSLLSIYHPPTLFVMPSDEAYSLLSFPYATITTPTTTHSGALALQYITFAPVVAPASASSPPIDANAP